ncbi:MAG: UDP-N-acetylglucosamine 2-epimerase (non-hydrolyzing) [Acidobacteria bacterium]|nr:UDP-N-acetylglucosamine 2-epimerase (non-hydrolyzing) [Acidobacteriota bacterium]
MSGPPPPPGRAAGAAPRVVTVLGTRPEIIKLSPVLPLLDRRAAQTVVHTGQHYSYEMDARFFEELGLRRPDRALAVGSASHGEQTARMLAGLEPVLLELRPDAVVVQGDTNTTLAAALAAAKLGIAVVHLEAGARSFDRRMPEEINRRAVDHMASLLLAADDVAAGNLRHEGIGSDRIHVVGSTAIDAVVQVRDRLDGARVLDRFGLTPGAYAVVTAHRAKSTGADVLPGLLEALAVIAARQPLVWPLHPRTRAAMQAQHLAMPAEILVTQPLGYLDMLRLVRDARALLTDSGGLQEEAAVLGTPALVLRDETEWEYLVAAGVQKLIGHTVRSVCDGAAEWLTPEGLASLRARPLAVRPGAAARAVETTLASL